MESKRANAERQTLSNCMGELKGDATTSNKGWVFLSWP